MPQVTMPDGAVVEMPDQVDPALGARLRAFQQSQAAPTAPAAPAPKRNVIMRYVDGALRPVEVSDEEHARVVGQQSDPESDPVANMLTSGAKTLFKGAIPAVGAIISDMGASMVSGLTAPFLGSSDDDSANFIRDFRSENTYQPAEGSAGSEVLAGLGDALAPIQKGKEFLGEKTLGATDSPLAATFAELLPDIVATAAGGSVMPKGRAPSVPAKTAPAVDRAPTVTRAREAGYKVRPSDAERIGEKTPGGTAETFAQRDLQRDLTLENQQTTNRHAREELGVPEGSKLTDDTYEGLKQPHYTKYEEADAALTKVPPPPEYTALLAEAAAAAKLKRGAQPTTTKVLSALRRRGFKNEKSDVVATQEAGIADLELADRLEEAFGARLEALGESTMLTEYQAARQSLAKIHDFQKSTRGGQVDADAMFKIGEKSPGKLTGRGKIIAEAAENFPGVTRSSLESGGAPHNKSERTMTGLGRDILAGVIRNLPGLSRYLDVGSDAFQGRLGTAADATRRTYWDTYGEKPATAAPVAPAGDGSAVPFTSTAGVTPSAAGRMSRDLELEADPVAGAQVFDDAPDTLTADTVPPVRGDIDFRPSRLGDEFEAAEAFADQRGLEPISPGDRSIGNANDARMLADDLGLDIRSGTQGAVGERELSDLITRQLSDDLGIMPPRQMEQLEFQPSRAEQPRRLDLEPPPGTVRGKPTKPGRRITARDSGEELGDQLTNNASGESSASVEAINRVKQEKEGGRERFVIDLDDTVTPLTGVDAVDKAARKGQVIVQRGVGKDEYTVLDRGGLTAQHAKGRVQAAMARLKQSLDGEQGLGDALTAE